MYLADIKRDDRFEGYLIVRSAEQRAADEAREHAVRADEQNLPVSTDLQHLPDRPRQAEEHDGHGTGHHERLLEALRYQPPTAEPQEATADNPQHICQDTYPWKQETPALLNESSKSNEINKIKVDSL